MDFAPQITVAASALEQSTAPMSANMDKISAQLHTSVAQFSAQTARLVHQSKQWQAVLSPLLNATKEMGDVKHWVGVMEEDAREVALTISMARQRQL